VTSTQAPPLSPSSGSGRGAAIRVHPRLRVPSLRFRVTSTPAILEGLAARTPARPPAAARRRVSPAPSPPAPRAATCQWPARPVRPGAGRASRLRLRGRAPRPAPGAGGRRIRVAGTRGPPTGTEVGAHGPRTPPGTHPMGFHLSPWSDRPRVVHAPRPVRTRAGTVTGRARGGEGMSPCAAPRASGSGRLHPGSGPDRARVAARQPTQPGPGPGPSPASPARRRRRRPRRR
jgi:hypothetical protein